MAAVELTVNVAVEVPPVPAIGLVLNETLTPAGFPEAERVTAELKPPETTAETVDVPELPCTTESEAGDADRVKPGLATVPASAVMSPLPLGLPSPVARS